MGLCDDQYHIDAYLIISDISGTVSMILEMKNSFKRAHVSGTILNIGGLRVFYIGGLD